MARCYVEIEEEEENFISISCYISSAYILKYMIQLVIEGNNQKTNMSVYDIPLLLVRYVKVMFLRVMYS